MKETFCGKKTHVELKARGTEADPGLWFNIKLVKRKPFRKDFYIGLSYFTSKYRKIETQLQGENEGKYLNPTVVDTCWPQEGDVNQCEPLGGSQWSSYVSPHSWWSVPLGSLCKHVKQL